MTYRPISRRWMLGALAAGVAMPVFAEAPAVALRPPPRPVPPKLPTGAEVVEAFGLPGKVSFALADVRSGEMIDVLRPAMRQPPASTAKALTAIYALNRLGPDYRFRTILVATGPVVDGRIKGDLILIGGGDPTLDTGGLGVLAASLHAAGVREVAGRFLVWAGAFPRIIEIDPDQPAHVGYNPSISALNLNFNRVHFEWKRGTEGYDVRMDARTASFNPKVSTSRMQVVDRAAPVYTYNRGDGVDEWTVARGALGGGGARWLPVRRPDLYAAEVFQVLAVSHGIALSPVEVIDSPPPGTEIARHESAPLDQILTDMLRFSTNLTAETVGITASIAGGKRPASLQDSARSMDAWLARGLGGRRPSLVDHSGLSGASRIGAADMVNALRVMGRSAPLAPLLRTFRVEDAKVPLSVVAKTGTLNFVSALVGYLTAPTGRELAFAIFTSDIARRDALSEAERDSPPGGKAWAGRARNLQRRLLAHWAMAHG